MFLYVHKPFKGFPAGKGLNDKLPSCIGSFHNFYRVILRVLWEIIISSKLGLSKGFPAQLCGFLGVGKGFPNQFKGIYLRDLIQVFININQTQ